MRKIELYVAAFVLSAVGMMTLAATQDAPFPGLWAIAVLFVVAFLLQLSATIVRGGDAEGSLSFIIHIASGVLFGSLWAGLLTALSTAIGQIMARKPALKLLFNTAQRTLAITTAILIYQLVGGTVPPKYLVPGSSVDPALIVGDVLAFFAAAFVYFIVNTTAVSGAVAIARSESFRRVWATNSLWVLGYDIGASSIALFVAWVFLTFNNPNPFAKLGFLAVFLPIIAAKHVYAKLNTLQNLYDELDKAYEKLELNVREQLEMMVRSIEARDPYTSGHSRRVAALSKAIAQDFGLGPEEVADIETAALMHDVGKIHAEFAPLLAKEGRLTEAEWEVMKTHAVKSAELVGLFSRFQGSILNMVRHHHERWDGKGYPDGIAAEAIPLGARIIMVSDTIDAMSTDRPYRKALSFEKVVGELLKYKAIQFDPALVDATVNSVTVRRLLSDKDFLTEQTIATMRAAPRLQSRPALRSQSSFWEGLRSAATGQYP